ncbi:AcrR family transcriptional regulator [Saccharopolyspora lacisalsi]|uniref:AcrR family transcriptional regulator n=1 Tax=Halosaccharopolyspora lacisalsi TaxID=1000566 RepID=A0A839E0E9_9PSEU|nr:TetR/AcrR family transcriptional regulator [Halosaccharopolyspora lacisalsi]MBA8825996.1 AcrR family transcriptional regulator [Halosaccharopolyspora lacisalsi]
MAVERRKRLSGAERREQVLKIAAEEFAEHGLHGVSAEVIASEAGITHAYVFRVFGTKKRLFLEVVDRAFATMAEGLATSAGSASGLDALAAVGRRYYDSLTDDAEVREAVRDSFGRLRQTVSDTTGLDAVRIKTFMAYGILLNTNAALAAEEVDADWANQATARVHPGLFPHLTAEANR